MGESPKIINMSTHTSRISFLSYILITFLTTCTAKPKKYPCESTSILPHGWKAKVGKEGRIYYQNKNLKLLQWENPCDTSNSEVTEENPVQPEKFFGTTTVTEAVKEPKITLPIEEVLTKEPVEKDDFLKELAVL